MIDDALEYRLRHSPCRLVVESPVDGRGRWSMLLAWGAIGHTLHLPF